MIKKILTTLLFALPMLVVAQGTPVRHITRIEILDEIQHVNSSATALVSRLKQERYALLLKKRTTEADFQYAPGMMSIHYDTPAGDCFVINGKQVMVTSKGKQRVMDVNEGIAKMLRVMLMAAMTGDYAEAMHYAKEQPSLTQTTDSYIVEVKLDGRKSHSPLSRVEATYDKGTKRIRTITMHQPLGGYTSYTLEHIVPNPALDKSLFVIADD